MTNKELAYFEDAINHETNIISIVQNSIDNLENEKLIEFLSNELMQHKQTKENLLNMLEEKTHE